MIVDEVGKMVLDQILPRHTKVQRVPIFKLRPQSPTKPQKHTHTHKDHCKVSMGHSLKGSLTSQTLSTSDQLNREGENMVDSLD